MTPNIQMKKSLCLVGAFLLITFLSAHSLSASIGEYQVSDISWGEEQGSFAVRISGSSEPTYTMYELVGPQRIVLDIAGGAIAPDINLPLQILNGPVRLIKGEVVRDQEPRVVRLEILLDEKFVYSLEQEASDIVLHFAAADTAVAPLAGAVDNRVKVTDIQVEATSPEKATVLIYGSGPIGTYELAEELKSETHSARLLIDLPEVEMEDRVIPVALDSPVALVQTKEGGKGGRIILDSAKSDLFDYDVQSSGNYLELTLVARELDDGQDEQIVAMLTGATPEGSGDIAVDAAFIAQASMQNEFADMAFAPGQNSSGGDAGMMSSNLNFTGYDEQKISVDFYKIDLHNVFRLIGEISNRNIVVDEAVSGSLTLSMNNVPWDFLLDVILNLKNLAKEDRFNTIVISPKSAGFSWPEQAQAELDVTEEPITVTKRLQTGRERVGAKRLIREASALQAEGKDREALALYEEAFQQWPENGDLAKRIATMAMAKLGQNAKAAHYAKIAVQKNPQDYRAALIAAMSLANMEKIQEAREYFDLAVSGDKPAKHALASYAAFSEQNGSYDAALTMLDQYATIYGSSLETMVSRARIYDQMGDSLRADEEYKAILLSGFTLPEDLKVYITNRVQ